MCDAGMKGPLPAAVRLGTPRSYADAFRCLRNAGVIDDALADRLARAAGFRKRVHRAAAEGPADLLRFPACLKNHARSRA